MTRSAKKSFWSTADLPQHERFDFWRDAVVGVFEPLSVDPSRDAPFNGTMEVYGLNDMWLAHAVSGAYHTRRSLRDADRVDGSFAHLLCPTKGRIELLQKGRRVVLHANQAAFLGGDEPFDVNFLGSENDLLSVQIPTSKLEPRVPGIRKRFIVELTEHASIGASLSMLVQGLPKAISMQDSRNIQTLGYTLLDLIEVAMREIDSGTKSASGINAQVDTGLILRFIETHLGDSDLSPAQVAEALNMSERTVHARFHALDTTFMQHVRRERLKRIAERLVAPEGSAPRVTDLVYEWGFSDVSTFNRAFRREYGVSPREFRRSQTVENTVPGN